MREQVSLDDSPRLALKGKEHVLDIPRAPSPSTSHVQFDYGRDDVIEQYAGRMGGRTFIDETQPFGDIHDTPNNILALTDTGRREWGFEHDASNDLGSPHCQQKRVSIERELPEEESQQIEMSCQSTPIQTAATARSMWDDFTTAVRDWRAPAVAGNETEEGWVSAKKGRWDSTEYGKQNADEVGAQMLEEHGTLNLNLLPERQGASEHTSREGVAAVCKAITGASKISSNGTWRGTARGRRPPAVQPRYHTLVSYLLGLVHGRFYLSP